jgi:hypothetical protein
MSFSKKHGADHSRVDRVQRGARITENAPGAYAAKDRERSVNGTDQLTHYDRSLKMARPERFERPTPRFVVWCSIQLSYGRVFRVTLGLNGPLHQKSNRKVAKERFSYPLRPELARSGTEASTGSGSGSRIQVGVADLENNRGELG